MKFFNIFYTIYSPENLFVDYGIKQVMCKTYPNFNDAHDIIHASVNPCRIAINNIIEVNMAEYFENLSDAQEIEAREKYSKSILGEIKILDSEEMESLGLDDERIAEINDAISESLATSVDFDVLVLRFISSIIKQYIELGDCSPTNEYYERFNINQSDIDMIDPLLYNTMLMTYKTDLAILADTFDSYIDDIDDEPDNNKLYNAFFKLSKILPGLWN